MTARTFAPLAGNVLNPERGFHRFIGLLDTSDLAAIRKGGSSLVYATVRLDAYRDKALPSSLLQDLQKATARLRAAGLKVVLRFAYNDGPYPNSAPDASAARILGHLDQLAPVLASEVDVIAVLQAGFIGAWGEWHTSTNGLDTNPEAWKAILQKVLDVVPKSRQTQVRTPHRKQDMFGGVLDPKDAFSGSAASRVGHVNDCFLASEDDFGTYEGDVVKWKSFVAKESPFVVVGGETCENAPPRSACATAKEELALLHFSYLNRDYHPDVIKGWQDGGCFDEIASKLGYRFAFAGASVPETVRPGGRFALEVRIENTGYAAPFNERPVRLVLTGPAGRLEVTLSGLDPRRWLPGTTVIKALIQLPTSLTAGTYSLSLWLPDASESLKSRSEYAVRLANAGTWEDATGLNTIGAFAVAPDASGSALPGATLGANEVSQILP